MTRLIATPSEMRCYTRRQCLAFVCVAFVAVVVFCIQTVHHIVVDAVDVSNTQGIKVAVVTGSNRGLGFEAVRQMCQRYPDWKIYLTARKKATGEQAVEKLESEGLRPGFHVLDVNFDSSIQAAADYFRDKYGGVDVLISNAGISGEGITPLYKEVEETLHTDYYGTLHLLQSFVPILRPGARVVLVSSGAADLFYEESSPETRRRFQSVTSSEDIDVLLDEYISDVKEGNAFGSKWPIYTGIIDELGLPGTGYSLSKLAVNLLGRITQKQFDAHPTKDLVVNMISPGYVDTDMTHHQGVMTVQEGAKNMVDVAMILSNKEKGKIFEFGD